MFLKHFRLTREGGGAEGGLGRGLGALGGGLCMMCSGWVKCNLFCQQDGCSLPAIIIVFVLYHRII